MSQPSVALPVHEVESRTPRIWAIMGHRAGENSQILAIASALGWPFEKKRLTHRRLGFVPDLLRRVTLSGVDLGRSTPLEPPWPDLVISAGFHNEPVCRWVREQSEGRTRLVHVGRTWARLEHFDLVITTPQYRLPLRSNVLHNHTTLHQVTRGRLASAASRWRPRLAHLPKPCITVLVGGSSGPYSFGPVAASRLGREASRVAREMGGSLLVTTSARTSKAAADVLEASVSVPSFFYRWNPATQDNPYHALLALADRLIVTGDSIAMLSEAVATGKPVWIFDLGTGTRSMRTDGDRRRSEEGNDFRLGAFLYRQIMRLGPQRLSRDVTLVHRLLVESGRAAWLGDEPRPVPMTLPDPVGRAVARVRALLNGRPRPMVAGRDGGGMFGGMSRGTSLEERHGLAGGTMSS